MNFGSLNYYIDLVVELLKKELKVRYKNNVLGYGWSIALPLTQAIIYYYAFKFIMRISIDNYALFLITGLFPWQWFANSVVSSTGVLLNNASLIKKTPFPREALIFASVLNDMVHFILSLPVIGLFMFIYKVSFPVKMISFLFVLIFLQFLVVSGMSLFLSSLNVFFRDLERLTLVFVNILFYLTPIIYDPSMVPERFRFPMLILNPIFPLIELYRQFFLGESLHLQFLKILFVQSIVIFTAGYFIFNKLKWRFSEVL